MENERNLVEYESTLGSIDESSIDDKSDYESLSTDALEDIRYGNHVNLNINSGDARLIIRDQIRQAQSEWK